MIELVKSICEAVLLNVVLDNFTKPPALPNDKLPEPSVIKALPDEGAVVGKVNV